MGDNRDDDDDGKDDDVDDDRDKKGRGLITAKSHDIEQQRRRGRQVDRDTEITRTKQSVKFNISSSPPI